MATTVCLEIQNQKSKRRVKFKARYVEKPTIDDAIRELVKRGLGEHTIKGYVVYPRIRKLGIGFHAEWYIDQDEFKERDNGSTDESKGSNDGNTGANEQVERKLLQRVVSRGETSKDSIP